MLIRLSLSPGEWLVEPREAGDEETEGARRNPSHYDPQVLNSFELKFKQRNLLGHVPLVQFFFTLVSPVLLGVLAVPS